MVKQHNRMRVLCALRSGDKSVAQLKQELHIGNTTAWRWLQELVDANEAHVRAMVNPETGGPKIAIYRAGPKPSNLKVRVQRIKTQSELSREYRKRLRESGEWEDRLAKMRGDYWTGRPIARDPLTAAFFGAHA